MSRDRKLNSSYLERKLRAIGLVGSSPLEDLADVQGFLILENDRPEWRLPGGEFLWGIQRTPAAGGAGTNAYVGVRNPSTTTLSVVTTIGIANNSAATQYYLIGMGQNLAPIADGIVFPRDSRNLQEIPATRRDTGTPVGLLAVNELKRVTLPAGGVIDLQVEYILVASPANPGPGIYVQEINGNLTLNANISGYERPLEGRVEIR